MNLAFFDFDTEDKAAVLDFLDSNALAHSRVHDALLDAGIIVPQFDLHYEEASADFLMVNAAECRHWASALGLTSPTDLDTADLRNKDELEDWLNNQQLFMEQVVATLNL